MNRPMLNICWALLMFTFSWPFSIAFSGITYREEIEIYDSLRGFVKQVELTGFVDKESEHWYIPYSSLEKVHGITLKTGTRKGSFRSVRDVMIADIQIPTNHFFTCVRAKKIRIPPQVRFSLSWSVSSRELLTLSSLPFDNQAIHIDSFFYSIRMPQGYTLVFDLINPHHLSYLKIDTVQGNGFQTIHFTAVPRTLVRTRMPRYKGFLFREDLCLARLLVAPGSDKGDGQAYLDRWYTNHIQEVSQMNDEVQTEIHAQLGVPEPADALLTQAARLVASRVKYISIEEGYNSFLPRDVNEVYTARQGDCKEMANLLRAILRDHGLEAYLALVGTTGHLCEMDFPSLVAGNHMVVALRLEGRWRFLDPTNKYTSVECPNPGIMGRMAFILNGSGGTFQRIPSLPAEKNNEQFRFLLKQDSAGVSGIVSYTCQGIPMNLIRQVFDNLSARESSTFVTDFFSDHVRNGNMTSPSIEFYTDSVVLQADISLRSSLLPVIRGRRYLSTDFLPMVMESLPSTSTPGRFMLPCEVRRTVTATLDFTTLLPALTVPLHTASSAPFWFSRTLTATGDRLSIHYLVESTGTAIETRDVKRYQEFFSACRSAIYEMIDLGSSSP